MITPILSVLAETLTTQTSLMPICLWIYRILRVFLTLSRHIWILKTNLNLSRPRAFTLYRMSRMRQESFITGICSMKTDGKFLRPGASLSAFAILLRLRALHRFIWDIRTHGPVLLPGTLLRLVLRPQIPALR